MPAPPPPDLVRHGLIVTLVALLGVVALPARAGAAPALRYYTATGVRTAGGANPVKAPDLAPGLYRDTYRTAGVSSADGTSKFYRVRLRRGQTPYLSVTEAAPGRPDTAETSLRVEATLAPVDRSVSGCQTTASGTGAAAGDDLDAATAVLSPGVVGGPDWDDCPVDAVYALHVTRSGSAFTGVPLEVEIAVRAEPPFPADVAPAATAPATNLRVAVGGRERTVIGGTGFGDAPTLPDGRYQDSFTTGERRYYRVHLGWGQRLAWTLTAAQLPELEDYQGSTGAVVLANPVRQVLAQPGDAEVGGTDLGATTGALFGSSLVPVASANRRSADTDVVPYSMAGDYYLIVSTAYPSSTQRTSTVPYVLTVRAVGAPTAGPRYVVDGPAVPHTGVDHRPVIVASVIGGVVVLAVVAVLLVRRRRWTRRATAR